MGPQSLKKWLPFSVKHPLIAVTQRYWDARGFPAQSTQDMSLIKALLLDVSNDVLRVWEWGSGRSTVYYPKFLNSIGRAFEWHAVDNNKTWLDRCQEEISRTPMANNIRLHHSEFPAFWELPDYTPDTPVPPTSWLDSPSVSKYVDFPKKIGGPFDLLVIDGRYRRRCLGVAKEVLSLDGVVVLHDAQRAHYHSGLDVFANVHFLETGSLPGTQITSTVALCTQSRDLSGLRLQGNTINPSTSPKHRGNSGQDFSTSTGTK